MKINPRYYSIIFAALTIACTLIEKRSSDEAWTEKTIVQYFKDSIAYRMYNGSYGEGDSLNDFVRFSKYVLKNERAKNSDDPFILGFDEKYIDTTKIDTSKRWLRITIDPVFRIPHCLILEQQDKKSILTLKMTDGRGGYYSGYLNFVSKEPFSDSLYNDIYNKLQVLNFWNLKEDSACLVGCDGETWTFESMHDGKYNLIRRWVPRSCGDTTTRQLAALGFSLRSKAKFKDYIQTRTNLSDKDFFLWYEE
jgi:hypothetical protein